MCTLNMNSGSFCNKCIAPQRSPGPLSGRKRPLAGGTRGKSPAKKTKSQTGIVLRSSDCNIKRHATVYTVHV